MHSHLHGSTASAEASEKSPTSFVPATNLKYAIKNDRRDRRLGQSFVQVQSLADGKGLLVSLLMRSPAWQYNGANRTRAGVEARCEPEPATNTRRLGSKYVGSGYPDLRTLRDKPTQALVYQEYHMVFYHSIGGTRRFDRMSNVKGAH